MIWPLLLATFTGHSNSVAVWTPHQGEARFPTMLMYAVGMSRSPNKLIRAGRMT